MSEFPKILYKYRSWNNQLHRNILSKNELYLAAPKDFNDPFDCRIPDNHALLDSDAKIDQYCVEKVRDQFPYLKDSDSEFEVRFQQARANFSDIEDLQQRHENLTFSLQDKHTGILSLSERWDSSLMWSHYADQHKGFCIGFKTNSLINSTQFGKGGPVIYEDEFPKLVPQVNPTVDEFVERSFRQTNTKAKDWVYEREYRFIVARFPEELIQHDRVINIPNSYFAEVVVGLNFPAQEIGWIKQLAAEKAIPIFQIKKIPFRFEFSREQIA